MRGEKQVTIMIDKVSKICYDSYIDGWGVEHFDELGFLLKIIATHVIDGEEWLELDFVEAEQDEIP